MPETTIPRPEIEAAAAELHAADAGGIDWMGPLRWDELPGMDQQVYLETAEAMLRAARAAGPSQPSGTDTREAVRRMLIDLREKAHEDSVGLVAADFDAILRAVAALVSSPSQDREALVRAIQQHVGGCREWVAEENNCCFEPAEYLLWGKLVPREALGPRCYKHAVEHVGDHALRSRSGFALVNVNDLASDLLASAPSQDREAPFGERWLARGRSPEGRAEMPDWQLVNDMFVDTSYGMLGTYEIVRVIPSSAPVADPEYVGALRRRIADLEAAPSQDTGGGETVPISLLRQWEADRNALLHAIVEHRDSTERSEERDERLWAVLSSERVRATSEVARAAVSSPTGDRERLVELIFLALAEFDDGARGPVSLVQMHREAAEHIADFIGELSPSSGDREREALTAFAQVVANCIESEDVHDLSMLGEVADQIENGDYALAVAPAEQLSTAGSERLRAALIDLGAQPSPSPTGGLHTVERLLQRALDGGRKMNRTDGVQFASDWMIVADALDSLRGAMLAGPSAPTGGEAAGARFEVGDLVVIDPDFEAFEYGGDAPFGGWVTRVWSDSVNVKYLGRCEADPDERQDGAGWCWGWPEHEIAVTDLRPMTGRDLAELQQQHVDAMRATDAVVIAARALASPAPSDGREAREDGGDDAH